MTRMSKAPQRAKAKTWRLLLVDDQPVMRHGIRLALEGQRGFEISAEAEDVGTAMRAVRETNPDLVILEHMLRQGGGLDLVKQLRALREELRILVFSHHDEQLYAERALRAGADGYLEKRGDPDRLVSSVRTILSGSTALSDSMTERLVSQAVHGEGEEGGVVARLSDRELEVFQLIGSGQSTRSIAEQLSISVKTVESHREHIKKKLEIHEASELARFAVSWVEHPS